MHRLFVAVRPPQAIRLQLLGLMGGVAGARWQDDEQLHITLRFIGEVDGRLAEDIDMALQSVRHAPMEIALSGVGAFDRRGVPIALWAGVAPHEQLRSLHKKIDHALARAGLAPERRAFLPHITLARFGRGGAALQPFLQAAGALTSPLFPVSDFQLFESRLTPGGAVYTPVARYALG